MLAGADTHLSTDGAQGASGASRPHRGEQGFALLEVVVSSLLVAIISIAVLDAFDVLGRTTANQRFHNQAAVLASESQEQLRSDPASVLDVLASDTEAKTPHTYKRTVGTETFTIVEQARHVTSATGAAGCNATGFEEATQPTGQYVRISSIVTWTQLASSGGKAVRQASTITPPDGSTLEVDVTDGGEAPVEGVSVEAEGIHTTTGSGGCVVYGSIPSTTVGLNASKPGYVTYNGAESVSASEVNIAPNITTHYPVHLAPAGTIDARFTHEGSTTYEGREVEGDTFVASQTAIAPEFELGGTSGAYATTASVGNIFPFTSAWSVYAGDCPVDNPAELGSETGATALVTGGQTTTVDVPTSYVELSVMTGSEPGSPGSPASTIYPVKLDDGECESQTAANESKAIYEHEQSTTTSGHLSNPFQPYGRWSLCLYDEAKRQTYTVSYENKTAKGNAETIYLGAAGTEEGIERNEVTILSNQGTNTC